MPSLEATCAHFLGQAMSKEEQRSDWSVRPLSAEQMRYAATDAAACLRVLEAHGARLGGAVDRVTAAGRGGARTKWGGIVLALFIGCVSGERNGA